VDAIVSPFVGLLENLSAFHKFKAVTESRYVNSAGVRAANATLPPKSQQELVDIRNAALASTNWHDIQDSQLLLLSYGATETVTSCFGVGAMSEHVTPPIDCGPRVVLLARTLDTHLRNVFFTDPQLVATGLFFYLTWLPLRTLASDRAYLQTMMSTLLKVQGQGLYPPDVRTGHCVPGSVCDLLQDSVDKTKSKIDALSVLSPLPGNIVRVKGVLGVGGSGFVVGLTPTGGGASSMSTGKKVAIGVGVVGVSAAAYSYFTHGIVRRLIRGGR
jgi:hypothetical protein